MSDDIKNEIDKLLKESPLFRDLYTRAQNDIVAAHYAQNHTAWPSWVEQALLKDKTSSKDLEAQAVAEKVRELRDRVKLDSIQKQASAREVPMSLKAIIAAEDEDLITNKANATAMDFIKNFVSAHRGNCDVPAVIYELRKEVGHQYVEQNKDMIESFTDQMCKLYKNPQTFAPTDNGSPIQVGSIDETGDRAMFKDIVKNLGNG